MRDAAKSAGENAYATLMQQHSPSLWRRHSACALMRERYSTGQARAGFTLLEVLVATVIMGIAVTGLIVGLAQSVKNASRLSEYDRASMLARTKMNDLLLDSDLPFDGAVQGAFAPDQSGGVGSGWRAVSKPFEAPPAACPGTVIRQPIS